MAATLKTRTLSVSIECPRDEVYDFASVPGNFPKWASGLGDLLQQPDGAWVAQMPQGPMKVRFTERNGFGILDHYVYPAPDVEIYIPMRVLANGAGSEVLFTLFQQPGMSDQKFAEDAAWVARDLQALKELLERR